ncbi:hypothetical protein [Acidovorax facilis]|uniref:hypothetical protein n=1 Tax=Acidovorax facilis TaxID=12917 RepID=UPI003D6612AC
MANPTVPDFTGVAARKLAELQANGYRITGYCFERQVEGTQPQRGFVDFAGFVGWWKAETMPDLSTLTERGAKAWAGVDPQKLREGGAL